MNVLTNRETTLVSGGECRGTLVDLDDRIVFRITMIPSTIVGGLSGLWAETSSGAYLYGASFGLVTGMSVGAVLFAAYFLAAREFDLSIVNKGCRSE